MRDAHGREVNYLRLAVTDRCNLRCSYCSPESARSHLPRSAILSYEEMKRLVSLLASLGVSKVRLTGGEPLVRKGVLDFAAGLGRIPGIQTLALTTNGTLLAEKMPEVIEAGIKYVNVSLDSLNPDRFSLVTGGGDMETVLSGIDAALKAGLVLKTNTVVIRGINEDEILTIACLAESAPIQVRFIEKMPFGQSGGANEFYSGREIETALRRSFHLCPAPLTPGLSSHFSVDGFMGSLAVIAPISGPFCGGCNRLRLTPDGRLKTCLLSEDEVDLLGPLRAGATESQLSALSVLALAQKKKQHFLTDTFTLHPRRRGMREIGG
jgi:cyclic pyranopterin phosphate synthase